VRRFRPLAAALGFGLALGAVGCRDEGVPDALMGRWVTDDPRYAGRSLTIDRATIAFGVGEAVSEIHAIDGVATRALGAGEVHTVRYRESDGGVTSVDLELVPGAGLRFENHEELWVRDEGRR